jgi:hypothetical protein
MKVVMVVVETSEVYDKPEGAGAGRGGGCQRGVKVAACPLRLCRVCAPSQMTPSHRYAVACVQKNSLMLFWCVMDMGCFGCLTLRRGGYIIWYFHYCPHMAAPCVRLSRDINAKSKTKYNHCSENNVIETLNNNCHDEDGVSHMLRAFRTVADSLTANLCDVNEAVCPCDCNWAVRG